MFWYKAKKDKELSLLKGYGLAQHAKQLGIQEVSDEITRDLASSIFICWHPEPNSLANKLLLDERFIKSENSLVGVWADWLG